MVMTGEVAAILTKVSMAPAIIDNNIIFNRAI